MIVCFHSYWYPNFYLRLVLFSASKTHKMFHWIIKTVNLNHVNRTHCRLRLMHQTGVQWWLLIGQILTEKLSHHDKTMSLCNVWGHLLHVLLTTFPVSVLAEYFVYFFFPVPYRSCPCTLSLWSYARRRTEASAAGSGGRLGSVPKSPGFVCGPEARGPVPTGLQNQHRSRGAAALQGLLLQGRARENSGRAHAQCQCELLWNKKGFQKCTSVTPVMRIWASGDTSVYFCACHLKTDIVGRAEMSAICRWCNRGLYLPVLSQS